MVTEVEKRTNELIVQKNLIEEKNNKLEGLNKTKDKFFSIIGHDLKGPVNALTFLTDMLYKDWDGMQSEVKKDYVKHIDSSTKQVKNLILSLLEWARTQSGQVKIEPQVLMV